MELHIHIHHHTVNEKEIINKLNQIIMTNQEAIDKLNAQATQLAKVRAEVQKLVDAAQNQGNVSPELEAAITNVENAIKGVDDLNPDEVVNPEGETNQPS
jgi:hypothetical protein